MTHKFRPAEAPLSRSEAPRGCLQLWRMGLVLSAGPLSGSYRLIRAASAIQMSTTRPKENITHPLTLHIPDLFCPPTEPRESEPIGSLSEIEGKHRASGGVQESRAC